MGEINRVLLPGGMVRLTTPNRLKYVVPSRRPLRGIAGLLGKANDPGHVHEYWPWELRRLLTVSGFRIQSLRFRARNRYIPWEPLAAGIDIIATKAWVSSDGACVSMSSISSIAALATESVLARSVMGRKRHAA